MSRRCVICGRELAEDRVSVLIGIGPECRKSTDRAIHLRIREYLAELVEEAPDDATG